MLRTVHSSFGALLPRTICPDFNTRLRKLCPFSSIGDSISELYSTVVMDFGMLAI
jgi:hypothetical protein